MKKILTAWLTIMVLFGLMNTAAVAEVMQNIRISDIQYYESGCLKGFTMYYDVGLDYASAPIRVGVQTKQFRKTTDGNPSYGDFTNLGEYAMSHPKYTTWPVSPADCGFIAWSGVFQRPGFGAKGQSLAITFNDHQIDCSQNKNYYVYVWANYSSKVYPDAELAVFKTNNGKIEGSAIVDTPPAVNPPKTENPPQTENPPKTVDMPKTGDNSQLILWLALSLLSGAGLLALMRRRLSDR